MKDVVVVALQGAKGSGEGVQKCKIRRAFFEGRAVVV